VSILCRRAQESSRASIADDEAMVTEIGDDVYI